MSYRVNTQRTTLQNSPYLGTQTAGIFRHYTALFTLMKLATIITLDHRRMLIPRNKNIRVLTLRGSDYPADADVLLNDSELDKFPVTQIMIEKSRHNDMYDGGPKWLVDRMSKEVEGFLDSKS